MKLLLIRHGQSEWNASGRWQGQADPPLTALGVEQAGLAIAKASELGLGQMFASDLDRARVTAETIASGIGLSAPTIEPLLRERDAGEFSGLTKEQIEEQFPGCLDSGERPPGYELDEPLLARVLKALQAVRDAATADCVGAVAHGGIIRLLEETFPRPESSGPSPEHIPNLAARWLTLGDNGEIELGARILLIDEADATVPSQI